MARKKKVYLVWQVSGSYDTYVNRLCGVFDSEEKASELKAKLDKNVVLEKQCWTIMPEEVYNDWPTVDIEGGDDYDYVSEYRGYTNEQREEQEARWVLMTEDYQEANIEEVEMNVEL
jgi:putative SOS response-associated peptidase YedK